jgi:hypothetical protein
MKNFTYNPWIPNLSSLLKEKKKSTQTLKSVNLGIHFLIFFNFNSLLEFSVKSYQNFQNTIVFILKI